MSAERALTRELLDHIVTQTDGVPLFIEELTKAMLEVSVNPCGRTAARRYQARCRPH